VVLTAASNAISVALTSATATDDVFNLTTTGSLDTNFGTVTVGSATAAIETVNLSAGESTATSSIYTHTLALADAGNKAVNLLGTETIALTISSTAVEKVDASALSAGLANVTASASLSNLTFTGSNQNDVFVSGSGNDALSGGVGDDLMDGGVGADTLDGGAGNDTLVAGAGVDSLTGGDGSDTLSLTGWTVTSTTDGGSSAVQGVAVNLGATAVTAATINALAYLGNGTDGDVNADILSVSSGQIVRLGAAATVSTRVSTYSSIENLIGSGGGDYLVGSSGANNINGGAGADFINPGSGADTVTGGAGDDAITITETTQSADTIVFSGVTLALNGTDTITGFVVGSDVLDVGPLSNAAVGTAITLDTAAALATEGTSIAVASGSTRVIGNVTNAGSIDTAADIATALTNGGILDAVDVADSGTAYLILSGLDVTTTVYVYGVTMDAVAGWGAGDSVVLLGTITTDSTTLLTSNLI
jgi:Ca2+-binding RTX toxin-like protein